MEENSVPLIANHGVQICSEFFWRVYAGLCDRVVRPNLPNSNENDKTLAVFHRNLKLDTLGKYYLLIPFQNFPRDAYPRPLLDSPLSVDIYLNSPSVNPASSPHRVWVWGWANVFKLLTLNNFTVEQNPFARVVNLSKISIMNLFAGFLMCVKHQHRTSLLRFVSVVQT